MDVDAIIAEASASATAQDQPKTDAVAEAPVETTETTAEPQADTKPEVKTEEAFPRKAVNAISYRDKKIGRLTEQKSALEKEVAELRAKAPKEADFEGKPYGDYLKAEAKHAAAEENKTARLTEIDQEAANEKAEWEAERKQNFTSKFNEAKKQYADFSKTVDPIMQAPMAPHVWEAILETENPELTLFAIAKDEALEDLNSMNPTRVAMQLARLEDKGRELVKPKATTKAPAPMTPAKGSATGGKPLHEQSVEELQKWVSNQ
jgi:hypothetical protein